ncbi:hypothetical protein GOP47_0000766 [Adiantum capillus-veneris]|uniref:EF-hand domain-containing protein n=1 Tax=Adiantum capillus-veneris TaxID=13818 RepID=A0A9D4VFQ8_ADICA|nr:hypothetical protein GOP47_0000766 [Adiantum capillus-veneris]
MGGSSKVMDGSNIKALVNDPHTFAQYVDDKFHTLDKTHNGKLSREELVPVALAIGNALGLPPKGSSPESDHIYDEVLGEFLQGKGESITKDEFTLILRDMLLGVADGLERDPVVLCTLSGSELETYANSNNFEVDAVGVFTQMEKGSDGKIPSSAIKKALEKVAVGQGMPPASDEKIAKDLLEPALQSAGVHNHGNLGQEEFLAAYRQSLLSVASLMKEKPVTVAHTEKCFDGLSITTFLKDESVLRQTLNETWISLGPFKAADGTLEKSNLRVGLDLLAPFAGLPPVGAVDEMDRVVDESFKLVDAEKGGFVNKDEFSKWSDVNPDDCLKL